MDKVDMEREGSELDSSDVQVAEEVLQNQPDPESQDAETLQDVKEGTRNKPPTDQQHVLEAAKFLKGHNLEQGEELQPALQVQQVEQAVEFVVEEAAISYVKQEPMEEVVDIEEPQKYAFREKARD